MSAIYYKESYPLRSSINRMIRVYRAIGKRNAKEMKLTSDERKQVYHSVTKFNCFRTVAVLKKIAEELEKILKKEEQ